MENEDFDFLDSRRSIPLGSYILRIKDVYHHWIDLNTWVYSNDPCFKGNINEFFRWVNQHGGDYSDIEVVMYDIEETNENETYL